MITINMNLSTKRVSETLFCLGWYLFSLDYFHLTQCSWFSWLHLFFGVFSQRIRRQLFSIAMQSNQQLVSKCSQLYEMTQQQWHVSELRVASLIILLSQTNVAVAEIDFFKGCSPLTAFHDLQCWCSGWMFHFNDFRFIYTLSIWKI